MKISEENFIRELKRRNEKALEHLVDNYAWLIKTVIKRHLFYLLNFHEECMNDCLLAIWDNIDAYKPERGSFKNWLGGIAKYKSLDYVRKYLRDLENQDIEDANAQSKISQLSYSIGRALFIEKDIEPYANVVDQVVESNGIEIKLADVIIDKDELIFSTIVDIGRPLDMPHFDCDIFINGKRVVPDGGGGTSRWINDTETILLKTEFMSIKDIDIKDDIDMRIIIKDLYHFLGDTRKKIKGKWEFEFTANGNELRENTYLTPLDYSFNIEDTRITLKEFRYNPVNQKIYGQIDREGGPAYDVKLSGQDNLGNEVEFGMSSMSKNEIVMKYQNIYGDLDQETTSITLTPYAVEFPEESGKLNDDWQQVGEEFTIYLNR